MNLDDYRERHAGDLNLKVDDQGYNFLQAGIGGKLEHYFDSGFTSEVHVNWFHQLLNEDLAQIAGFRIAGSPSFRTKGLKPERNTFNVGAGVTLLSVESDRGGWSLEALYDYEWRTDDYAGHKGAVRVTNRF